ncbi:uncharacterized protein [Penaeus vannamei]|uniref:uncharacterized protein n=1 Tax=Penaeus vannamei TaxID=6689 RepID=UPI00387F93C0
MTSWVFFSGSRVISWFSFSGSLSPAAVYVFCFLSAAAPQLSKTMHTHGPTKPEGRLLAQGNAPPSQGTGTSAQGYGPPGSMGTELPPCPREWAPLRQPGVKAAPRPIPATSNPPLPIPSPLSLPAASQLPRAPADSPAANLAEPSSCPSPGAPSQQTLAPTDAPAFKVNPRFSRCADPKPTRQRRPRWKLLHKQHLNGASGKDKTTGVTTKATSRPQPPLGVETAQQQVQGATAPTHASPPPAAPPFIINTCAERAKSTMCTN